MLFTKLMFILYVAQISNWKSIKDFFKCVSATLMIVPVGILSALLVDFTGKAGQLLWVLKEIRMPEDWANNIIEKYYKDNF